MTADNRTLFVKFPCLPGAAERAALGICRAGVPAAATEVTRRHLASVQRVSDECGFSALTPRMVAAPVHGTTPAVGACLTRACPGLRAPALAQAVHLCLAACLGHP